MPRLYLMAVASAAVVGITIGVVLHHAFGTSRAEARPTLPALYGEATWGRGQSVAPRFALRDQHGRMVRLASYRGRTVVLVFMDSLCTSECPIEARQLAAAIRPLARSQRPQLVVVSIDVDDSRSSVAAAARRWGLPVDFEWLFGTHAQLARVWRAYHIYVERKPGDIVHSDAFYVIDRSGGERAGFVAPFAPGLLTQDLRRLASSA